MRIPDLACSYGKILDMSATGLRIRHGGLLRPKKGKVVRVTLCSYEGAMRVRCKVMRVQRDGLFNHDVGLVFVDLDDHGRALLNKMARESPVTSRWFNAA